MTPKTAWPVSHSNSHSDSFRTLTVRTPDHTSLPACTHQLCLEGFQLGLALKHLILLVLVRVPHLGWRKGGMEEAIHTFRF